jgi:hypothetical protein
MKVNETFQGKNKMSEVDILKTKIAELEAQVKQLTPEPISEEKK